jgi:basic membrane protein A and related proteins
MNHVVEFLAAAALPRRTHQIPIDPLAKHCPKSATNCPLRTAPSAPHQGGTDKPNRETTMTLTKTLMGAAATLALSAGFATAEPAVIYDLGGKFDKSFNEAAYNGAEKWKAETGGTYKELEMQNEAQREQALRSLAEEGANPIVTTGFGMSDPIAAVAADFPDTKFVTIDGYVDPAEHPNVLTIGFSEHEGSYLVGMLAAMASKTGTVSFVGGMDIPLIRNFACGYAQGAKAVKPDIKFISAMTGTTPAAWNDPVKGAELAKAQKAQGSDVIFAAAGGTGVGVLQAAADEGILSIGVDSNQNYLFPGKVLTSMLKRVDVAVYNSMKAGDALDTTMQTLDLKSDGVGYALDDNNKDLITPEMKTAVDAAAEKIKSGEIVVHDYRTDNTCPAAEF